MSAEKYKKTFKTYQAVTRHISRWSVVLALAFVFGIIPPVLAEIFQEPIGEVIGNSESSSSHGALST